MSKESDEFGYEMVTEAWTSLFSSSQRRSNPVEVRIAMPGSAELVQSWKESAD